MPNILRMVQIKPKLRQQNPFLGDSGSIMSTIELLDIIDSHPCVVCNTRIKSLSNHRCTTTFKIRNETKRRAAQKQTIAENALKYMPDAYINAQHSNIDFVESLIAGDLIYINPNDNERDFCLDFDCGERADVNIYGDYNDGCVYDDCLYDAHTLDYDTVNVYEGFEDGGYIDDDHYYSQVSSSDLRMSFADADFEEMEAYLVRNCRYF